MNRSNCLRLHFSIEDQISELYNYALERMQESESSFELAEADQPEEQLHELKQII